MPDSDKAVESSQITREIIEDSTYLGRVLLKQLIDGFRNAAQDETARLTKTLVRVLITLPLLMMASLFAGAAAIEWLAENVMISLTTVYAIGAAVFAILAMLFIMLPVSVSRRTPTTNAKQDCKSSYLRSRTSIEPGVDAID